MRSQCQVCGLVFDREYGYFTGAMYISYALGIGLIAVLTALFRSMTSSWPMALGLAWIAFLPFAPWVFQYSRVLWIHFDRWIDPVGEEKSA